MKIRLARTDPNAEQSTLGLPLCQTISWLVSRCCIHSSRAADNLLHIAFISMIYVFHISQMTLGKGARLLGKVSRFVAVSLITWPEFRDLRLSASELQFSITNHNFLPKKSALPPSQYIASKRSRDVFSHTICNMLHLCSFDLLRLNAMDTTTHKPPPEPNENCKFNLDAWEAGSSAP